MGEVLPKRREVFIDMIYVMFGLMAFTMIFNLACLILSLSCCLWNLHSICALRSHGQIALVQWFIQKRKKPV